MNKFCLCTASLVLTKLSIVLLHKTRLDHAISRQKIPSSIWVAIPVDRVILNWFPCGVDGRALGRAHIWSRDFQNFMGG